MPWTECAARGSSSRTEIVEDGKYEQLIEKGGVFAELVERQRLDK